MLEEFQYQGKLFDIAEALLLKLATSLHKHHKTWTSTWSMMQQKFLHVSESICKHVNRNFNKLSPKNISSRNWIPQNFFFAFSSLYTKCTNFTFLCTQIQFPLQWNFVFRRTQLNFRVWLYPSRGSSNNNKKSLKINILSFVETLQVSIIMASYFLSFSIWKQGLR